MIIGRTHEQAVFSQILSSGDPQFLAVYGRRRVGKTYLISEYFKDKGCYFEITGIKNASRIEQLEHFSKSVARYFQPKISLKNPLSWTEAFEILRALVSPLLADKKVILFFDELPWLAGPRSQFIGALDHFWNTWASRQSNIIVIVCGSAASWMMDNIIYAKGGLHNRLTKTMCLLPFNLVETRCFLQSRRIIFDEHQLLEIFLAMGGVPYYLKQIQRGLSAVQNIEQIFFKKDGVLFDEMSKLCASLFENSEKYERVLKVLSRSRYGLSRDALIRMAGLTSGGGAREILKNLEESGFIANMLPLGMTDRGQVFRIFDEFTLFHHKWIAPALRELGTSNRENYWAKMAQTPSWQAWAGFGFEGVCLKHIDQIKKTLGISGIMTTASFWRSSAKGLKKPGAQIDLLIDRADRCISVCEIKFASDIYQMTKIMAENIKNKLAVFRRESGTKKTLLPVLITTFGCVRNEHFVGLIQNEITLKDLLQ